MWNVGFTVLVWYYCYILWVHYHCFMYSILSLSRKEVGLGINVHVSKGGEKRGLLFAYMYMYPCISTVSLSHILYIVYTYMYIHYPLTFLSLFLHWQWWAWPQLLARTWAYSGPRKFFPVGDEETKIVHAYLHTSILIHTNWCFSKMLFILHAAMGSYYLRMDSKFWLSCVFETIYRVARGCRLYKPAW